MQRSLFSFSRRDMKRKIVLATGPRFLPHRLDTARKVRDSLAGRFFSTGSTPLSFFPSGRTTAKGASAASSRKRTNSSPDGVEIRKASSWLAGLEL